MLNEAVNEFSLITKQKNYSFLSCKNHLIFFLGTLVQYLSKTNHQPQQSMSSPTHFTKPPLKENCSSLSNYTTTIFCAGLMHQNIQKKNIAVVEGKENPKI